MYLEQWSPRDRALAEGLLLQQDETCTCGNPRWLCHHPDTQGQWDVVDDVCYAAEALAQAMDDGAEPEPGLMRHTVLKDDYTPPRMSVLRTRMQAIHDHDRGIIR